MRMPARGDGRRRARSALDGSTRWRRRFAALATAACLALASGITILLPAAPGSARGHLSLRDVLPAGLTYIPGCW